jgi:hypothetical protein
MLYGVVQDILEQLDDVERRIAAVTDGIRVAGLCAPQHSGKINQALKLDNKVMPLEDYMAFVQNGGMQGAFAFFPIEQHARVLGELYATKERLKQSYYEITGISDIVRGQTSPTETATAQQLKGHYNNLRVKPLQMEFERFVKDTIAIVAEVVAEQFSTETLFEASGAAGLREFQENPPIFEEAVRLLKEEGVRNFRIDVETDSTVALNEQSDKQQAMEFLSTFGNFLGEAVPLAQAVPMLQPALTETALYVIRKFNSARNLESTFEAVLDAAEQAAQQPKQQGPDPKVQQAMMEMQQQAMEQRQRMQLEMAKLQQDAQKAQAEYQAEMTKIRSDYEVELVKAKAQIEMERERNLAKLRGEEIKAEAAGQRELMKEVAETNRQQMPTF